jgi:predicted peptidase
MRLPLRLLVGLGVATLAAAEPVVPVDPQTAASATVTTQRTLHYLVQLPVRYADSARDWPLLVFLHGSGERGSDLKQVENNGPPKLIAAGLRLPFVVVSPQCPEGQPWYGAEIDALVENLLRTYRIDARRVYLTGLSLGGYGAWDAAIYNPARYAAILPVCGGGFCAEDAARLKQVPVWAFHGAKDPFVPLSEAKEYVAAVVAAGGDAKLTIYPEGGHDVWTETYANPEVYTWLLAHARP